MGGTDVLVTVHFPSLSSDYYQEMLEKHLVEIRLTPGKTKFTILLNGARCHVAQSTLGYFY